MIFVQLAGRENSSNAINFINCDILSEKVERQIPGLRLKWWINKHNDGLDMMAKAYVTFCHAGRTNSHQTIRPTIVLRTWFDIIINRIPHHHLYRDSETDMPRIQERPFLLVRASLMLKGFTNVELTCVKSHLLFRMQIYVHYV